MAYEYIEYYGKLLISDYEYIQQETNMASFESQ